MSSPQDTTNRFLPTPSNESVAPARRPFSTNDAYYHEATAQGAPPQAALSNASRLAGQSSLPPLVDNSVPAGSPHAAFPVVGGPGKANLATSESRSATRLKLSPINLSLPADERSGEVLRLAIEAFPQTDSWVVFYREIFGLDGVIRKLYPSVDALRLWEQTDEFNEVHTMLAALRTHDNGKGDSVESQRMITIRIPASLHEALKVESDEAMLSINKLCITKLLHKMDARFVPEELGKRRGRKPGPQGKRPKKAEVPAIADVAAVGANGAT